MDLRHGGGLGWNVYGQTSSQAGLSDLVAISAAGLYGLALKCPVSSNSES